MRSADHSAVWQRQPSCIAVWDGETIARDGVPYENHYVWVFRLVDGKAIEVEAFLDLDPYYEVLRRVPLPVRTSASPLTPIHAADPADHPTDP